MLLGFHNPGGYVYIVKYILPNQETFKWALSSVGARLLTVNQRRDWGAGQRGEAGGVGSLHPLLLPPHFSPCPLSTEGAEKGIRKDGFFFFFFKGSFPTLHTDR